MVYIYWASGQPLRISRNHPGLRQIPPWWFPWARWREPSVNATSLWPESCGSERLRNCRLQVGFDWRILVVWVLMMVNNPLTLLLELILRMDQTISLAITYLVSCTGHAKTNVSLNGMIVGRSVVGFCFHVGSLGHKLSIGWVVRQALVSCCWCCCCCYYLSCLLSQTSIHVFVNSHTHAPEK